MRIKLRSKGRLTIYVYACSLLVAFYIWWEFKADFWNSYKSRHKSKFEWIKFISRFELAAIRNLRMQIHLLKVTPFGSLHDSSFG
jgi:hypothetical protein